MSHSQHWTRRRFLKASAAATFVGISVGQQAQGADDVPLIIDCHAHIYGEDAKTYPTIDKPYSPPAGTGTIAHLRKEMLGAGVKFVTAIQTSTYYGFDNRFTVDSSRANRDFMVGVCTLNPDDAKSPGMLEKYVKEFNVRGMRSIPAKSGKLDDPGVERLWSKAEDLGIVINVLVNADKREEIESLARRHPKLRIVIDHCLNLKAGPTLAGTLKEMLTLRKLPLAHAKLSFMATGSAEKYPFRDMHDPCRQIIQAFGADRCVWGSDFPCELWCPKTTYAQNLRLFTHELGLDAAAKRAILGETPKRLWFSRE